MPGRVLGTQRQSAWGAPGLLGAQDSDGANNNLPAG